MVNVTYQEIADAIIALYWDRVLVNVDSLIHWLFAQNYRKRNGPFTDILRQIFPEYGEKTIQAMSNLSKCWYAFHRNSVPIKSILNTRKDRCMDLDRSENSQRDNVLDMDNSVQPDEELVGNSILRDQSTPVDFLSRSEELCARDPLSRSHTSSENADFTSDQPKRRNSVSLVQLSNLPDFLLYNKQSPQDDPIKRDDESSRDAILSQIPHSSGNISSAQFREIGQSNSPSQNNKFNDSSCPTNGVNRNSSTQDDLSHQGDYLPRDEHLNDNHVSPCHNESETKEPAQSNNLSPGDSCSQQEELYEDTHLLRHELNQDGIQEKRQLDQVQMDSHTSGIIDESIELGKFDTIIEPRGIEAVEFIQETQCFVPDCAQDPANFNLAFSIPSSKKDVLFPNFPKQAIGQSSPPQNEDIRNVEANPRVRDMRDRVLIEDLLDDESLTFSDFDDDLTEAFHDLTDDFIIHESNNSESPYGDHNSSSVNHPPIIIIDTDLIFNETDNNSGKILDEPDITRKTVDREMSSHEHEQDKRDEEIVELDRNCSKDAHCGEGHEEQGPFVYNILLPSDFWAEFWVDGTGRLKHGWVDVFNKYFEKALPGCVFKSKDNKCKPADKKRKTYFWSIGSCKNHFCTDRFIITARDPIKAPYHDVNVVIETNKPIKHDPEDINARFIRGPRRNELRKTLKEKLPHEVFLKMANDAPEEALKAGNHNDAPHLPILRTISSENHKAENLDKDFYLHLLKLKEKLKGEWSNSVTPGYIQHLGLDPFYVVSFTGAQLEYLLSLLGKGRIFLHLDSTGRIVACPPGTHRQIQYYALVLPGNGSVVLPIADFISNNHRVYDIHIFLSAVVTALKAHAARKNILLGKIVDKIEVDWSTALMNAVVRAFNDTTLPLYLVWAWKFCKGELDEDLKYAWTILHICSAHMFRAVRQKLHIMTNDEKLQNFGKMIITKLIHATSLEEAALIFTSAVIVLCSPSFTSDIEIHLDNIKKIYTEGEEDGLEEEMSFCGGRTTASEKKERKKREGEEGDQDAKEEVDLEEKLRHGSPFYKYFHEIYNELVKGCLEDTQCIKNPYYCPKFINYLLEQKMPFFALWSGVLIEQFDIVRDTNATVENYFKLVKFWKFKKEVRIVAPRFIREMQQRLRELLTVKNHKWVTSRQLRGRKRKTEEQKTIPEKKIRLTRGRHQEDCDKPKDMNDSPPAKTTSENEKASHRGQAKPRGMKCAEKVMPSSYSQQKEEKLMKKKKKSVLWDLEEEKWMKLPNGAYRRPRYFCLPQDAKKAREMKGRERQRVTMKSREVVEEEPIPVARKSEERDIEREVIFSNTDEGLDYDLDVHNTESPKLFEQAESQPIAKTSFDGSSALQINLLRRTLTYPDGFPKGITIKLFGETIDAESWKTLENNEKLNDIIMNSFLLLVEDIAHRNDFKILCLHTVISAQIFHSDTGHVSEGFYNWAKRKKIWQYDLWLMPVHINWDHWTLLLINFDHKCFVYLDSLHSDIPPKLIDGVGCYIQTCCTGKRAINWNDWRVFVPRDIPHQYSSTTANNCGVHASLYAYVIATSSYTQFTEKDMKYARMGVAQMLFGSNQPDRKKLTKERGIKPTADAFFNISELPLPKINLPISYEPPRNCDSTLRYLAFLKFNMEESYYTRRR